MHSALECEDIFQAICSALEAPGRLETLAALAITCKALSEPALDALWEELRNFDCLLNLLPRDLFVEFAWDFARPIMPVDWTRPHFYASRVKKLLISWESNRISQVMEILKAIGPFYPSGGLLPNLRYLGFNDQYEYPCRDLTSLRILLHLQVKEVSLSFSPSIANLSFLSALPVMCPHLTHVDLSFRGEEYCPEAAAVVSTLVPTLQALESLCFNANLDVGALNLGLLPNLIALSLEGRTELIAGSFPRLRELTILDIDTVSVIQLFRSAADLGLVKLDLGLSPATSSPRMAKLVRVLKSVASPTSLKTLTLRPPFGYVDTIPADRIMADVLRGLSFFCALTNVIIKWSFGPDIDDSTLGLLTESWTQLRNLQLQQIQANTNLTLKSLLALARNCPYLHHLELMVDASHVPELPPIAPQRTLTHMHVVSSPIQSATKVARYISGIFPDVEHIWSSTEFPERRRLWDQVLEQLPEFVAVRKEEVEKARTG
ncbi:F-box domain-containing protein [Mycena sanguinolenta]|uniref:F-box domain-containing protein n=1 Tax=Mycena sanguinolenta TaxID=230812 RepID=A0A8H6Z6N2_9AGAR|nr:F-box domain-containing protein [Mycena sanguinolenta]